MHQENLILHADTRERFREIAEGDPASSLAKRARIVLALAVPGVAITRIARTHRTSRSTILLWRERFIAYGVAGLNDAERTGAPRRIDDRRRGEIIAAGQDAGGRSTRSIAAQFGISQASVVRILREAQANTTKTRPARLGKLSNRTLESLILSLIECISDSTDWRKFLKELANITGSIYCNLLIYSGDRSKPSLILHNGVPEQGLIAYMSKFYTQEPFLGIPEGKIATLSEILPSTEFHKTVFYKEFLKGTGIDYVLGVDIADIHGISGKLRLSRLGYLGDYKKAERDLLQSLLPYLRPALSAFIKLVDLEAQCAAFSSTVSGMAIGSITVDPAGCVIEANAPATAILNQRDGVFLSQNRLCLVDRDKSRLLHQLIQMNAEAALSASDSASIRALLVDRPSGREAIHLMIRPGTSADRARIALRPTALVHIIDPSQPNLSALETLMQLYALTPTEARVALSLSNGQTIDEIARSTGASRNTIRSHINALFAKIGVNRQTALIRKILRSIVPISG